MWKLALGIALVGCSKSDLSPPEGGPGAQISPQVAVSTPPPAPPAPPAPSASPASPSPRASAASAASGAASAVAPSAPCGKKPLPDCPLQGWMKTNTSAAMKSKDFAALRTALLKMAEFAPERGYPNWSSIANDGADAAIAEDLDAVKAACRGCHEQYRASYRTDLRSRPLP